MIESMTGFGKTILQLSDKKISIEIKSLNSKNIDIVTRIPADFKTKELEIRKKLANKLVRGKIAFSIYIEQTGVDVASTINTKIVEQYLKELNKLSTSESDNLLEIAMRMPDVFNINVEEIDEKEWQLISEKIDKTIDLIIDYRRSEGKSLENDFKIRITNIESLLEKVHQYDDERKELLRGRLQKAIDDLKQKVDENRFEQELIYYLEKLDITEEQVRLSNHLSYFSKILGADTSQGRKLGFITQEMGREINTIGSKANFAPMQKVVVQMKDELEKIKEQNLNVL